MIRPKELHIFYNNFNQGLSPSPPKAKRDLIHNINQMTKQSLKQNDHFSKHTGLNKSIKPLNMLNNSIVHISPKTRQYNWIIKNNNIDHTNNTSRTQINSSENNKNTLPLKNIKQLNNTDGGLYSKDSRETSESNSSQTKCIIESNLIDYALNDSREILSKEIESIEEAHYAFVAISLESKKMIIKQENNVSINDDIFCFNTVLLCEERDIENLMM